LALKVLPLFRFFRAPYRWTVGAEVALGALAALGVAGARARTGPGSVRAIATAAALALVIGGAVLDVRGLRAPLTEAAVPAAYGVGWRRSTGCPPRRESSWPAPARSTSTGCGRPDPSRSWRHDQPPAAHVAHRERPGWTGRHARAPASRAVAAVRSTLGRRPFRTPGR